MNDTTVQRIQDQIDNASKSRTKLYFITRLRKDGVKKSDKMLDKFEFKTYQVDIEDAIREELFDTACSRIRHLIVKETQFDALTVINDGLHVLLTYSMTNRVMPFKDVVEVQLPASPPQINSLSEIVETEELWAYVIGMYNKEKDWIYAFRKITKGKVAIDHKDNDAKTVISRALRTYFNTTNQKLELIEGDTVVLDKGIDCFYFEQEFYVHKQMQFEQIVGLEEEYREQAELVVGELEASGLIEGGDVLRAMLEEKPMHKKLARLSKLELYKRVDAKTLKKMVLLAKRRGFKLNVSNGKFVLKEKTDVDLVIKMLCAYFKKDEVFGDSYGTFSGTKLVVLKIE